MEDKKHVELGGEPGQTQQNNRLKVLRGLDFFAGFTTEELVEVLKFSNVKKFETNEYIIKENAVDYFFFVILQGRVSVIKGGRNRKQNIAALIAGDCFGEMALLLDGHRSTSVMASSHCYLLSMDGQAVKQMNPATQLKFIWRLAKSMADKLKSQNITMVEII